jgi:hypothetical protein
MHGVRSQRRLARMTGREVPPVEMLLKRRTVREVHINGRSSTRVGLAGANMNVPSVIATCASFHSSFLLHCPHVSYPPSGEANTLVAVADPSSGGFSPLDEQAQANDTLTPANTPQTANSLGLAIQSDDVGYVATIQMGTPPRNFNVLMDSGSADLWVGAEGCISDNGSNCVSPSLERFIFPVLIFLRCIGGPRVSRIAVLILVRGHPEAVQRNLWHGFCGGRCHQRQHHRRWTAASWSHLWRGQTRNCRLLV